MEAKRTIDAARSLLADLSTGSPVKARPDGGDDDDDDLEARADRVVAKVRAYASAAKDPSTLGTAGRTRSPTVPLPAHERYSHYKMYGFAGRGATTSWAK